MGIIITYITWYVVDSFDSILPTTTIRVIFWIGLVVMWISAVILAPISMILKDRGSGIDIVKGIASFFGGVLLSVVSYYVVPPILNSISFVSENSTFMSIFWGSTILFWVFAMIILPNYLITRSLLIHGDS